MYNFINKHNLIFLTISTIIILISLIIETNNVAYLEEVLNISSNSSNLLSSILDYFDIGYSFVAGSLAAVNPCGIVMLPVYLALYVRGEDGNNNLSQKLNSSFKVIISVGLGFIILFVLISGIVFFSKSIIGSLIPYISIFLSIFIIYFGIGEIFRKKTFNSTLMSLGNKIGNPKNIGVIPYVLFGISYGLVSVGCALPIFISLVTKTLDNSFFGILINFIMYSLGMLFVIAFITFSALFSVNSFAKFNNFIRSNSSIIFGLFLTMAGMYMLSYWIIDLRITS